jgi:hypothetical protein
MVNGCGREAENFSDPLILKFAFLSEYLHLLRLILQIFLGQIFNIFQEAEFQAWKRRKNYDPLKSAAASASSQRKNSSPKNAYSPTPNSGPGSPSPTGGQHLHNNNHSVPQHRRIQVIMGCVPGAPLNLSM